MLKRFRSTTSETGPHEQERPAAASPRTRRRHKGATSIRQKAADVASSAIIIAARTTAAGLSRQPPLANCNPFKPPRDPVEHPRIDSPPYGLRSNRSSQDARAPGSVAAI